MKVLTGIKKSEFLNNYCILSKEKQFLLIDIINITYPFTANNLLILKSNNDKWLNDIIASDKELSKDFTFILFSNDNLSNIDYYKEKLKSINREFIIVLQGEFLFKFGITQINEV